MKLRKLRNLTILLLVAGLFISAISVDRLRAHVTWLADPAREGRQSGSPGSQAAAEYIAGKLRETGYEVQMQSFGGNRQNVIGRWGTAEKYILIGSHYDGQGKGFPSASDNAAGTAVVLELARELKDEHLPVSIVAVAFDDEEQGMNGSRYYVDHSPYPLESATAALVMDTLGRSFMDLSSWTMFVLGTEYSKELAAVIEKRNRPEIIDAGTDLIGPRSDFASFAVKHVPYLFFTDGTHKDYHGAGDTVARVDYTHLAQDAAVISQIARDVAELTVKPKYLDDPIYPKSETDSLEKAFDRVEMERKDLPPAYHLMFADLRTRLKIDKSRDTPQLSATALLALATPRLSATLLTFFLGPFYEGEKKAEIAAAIYEEALKYTEEGAGHRELERKIKLLRGGL